MAARLSAAGKRAASNFPDTDWKIRTPLQPNWSHCVFLLGIKKADERDFYEIEAANQDWTVRELKRQFDSGLYERLALSRDKDRIRQLAQQGQIVSSALRGRFESGPRRKPASSFMHQPCLFSLNSNASAVSFIAFE